MRFSPIAVITACALACATPTVAAAQSSNPLVEPAPMPVLSSEILPEISGEWELQDVPAEGTGARLESITQVKDNLYSVDIYSPAMGTVISNNLVMPDNEDPRPTLYLLQGSNGGQTGASWPEMTNYQDFFNEKQVNVISPIGGKGSFFSDWLVSDDELGTYKWKTYILQELPEVMQRYFKSTDVAAISGMSMSGTASLNLAASAPEQFVAVSAISPYPSSSSLFGRLIASAVTTNHGADSSSMWGYPDNPAWVGNDPFYNMDKLEGIKIYTTTGTGFSQKFSISIDGIKNTLAEWGSRIMTDRFVKRAAEAGLDIHYDRENYGSHDWLFFESQTYKAWNTTLGPALGVQ